jgi:hypothetical protein
MSLQHRGGGRNGGGSNLSGVADHRTQGRHSISPIAFLRRILRLRPERTIDRKDIDHKDLE